jgi:hypothetical protein
MTWVIFYTQCFYMLLIYLCGAIFVFVFLVNVFNKYLNYMNNNCLFVCFESHKQFLSYLATVTIAGDRAANLDLCLALTAFSSEGSFTCHTYCDTGHLFLRSYPKDPWFYPLNAVILAKEQSLPILNVLGLTRPARAGLELTTHRLLSKSTATRLIVKTN